MNGTPVHDHIQLAVAVITTVSLLLKKSPSGYPFFTMSTIHVIILLQFRQYNHSGMLLTCTFIQNFKDTCLNQIHKLFQACKEEIWGLACSLCQYLKKIMTCSHPSSQVPIFYERCKRRASKKGINITRPTRNK